ncbi:MAG: hypothetical protein AB4040_00695 [Synechococcus sp.]
MTSIHYETRILDIPHEFRREAARVLTEMGLSLRSWSDGTLSVLIRCGFQGALDRLAILHLEMRFSHNCSERLQWLEMCWQLPSNLSRQYQN